MYRMLRSNMHDVAGTNYAGRISGGFVSSTSARLGSQGPGILRYEPCLARLERAWERAGWDAGDDTVRLATLRWQVLRDGSADLYRLRQSAQTQATRSNLTEAQTPERGTGGRPLEATPEAIESARFRIAADLGIEPHEVGDLRGTERTEAILRYPDEKGSVLAKALGCSRSRVTDVRCRAKARQNKTSLR